MDLIHRKLNSIPLYLPSEVIGIEEVLLLADMADVVIVELVVEVSVSYALLCVDVIDEEDRLDNVDCNTVDELANVVDTVETSPDILNLYS